MSEKLEIEKDRVLKAAEKCPQAKEILSAIFPDVFEGEWELSPYQEIELFAGIMGHIYVREKASANLIGEVEFIDVSGFKYELKLSLKGGYEIWRKRIS